MKTYKNFVLLFIIVVFGCATGGSTVSKDKQYANKGFEALSQGRYGDAESYLEKALAENPNDPYALLNLGVVYQDTRRPEKARMLYEKVIKLNPTEIVSRSNIEGKVGKTIVDLAKENLQAL